MKFQSSTSPRSARSSSTRAPGYRHPYRDPVVEQRSGLATATFTNETASGWQTATFSSPVALTAGTTYTASYHTNAGRYSTTSNGSPTRDERIADRAGERLVRAATASSPMAAPACSRPSPHRSNYWVDVVFNPSAAALKLTVTRHRARGDNHDDHRNLYRRHQRDHRDRLDRAGRPDELSPSERRAHGNPVPVVRQRLILPADGLRQRRRPDAAGQGQPDESGIVSPGQPVREPVPFAGGRRAQHLAELLLTSEKAGRRRGYRTALPRRRRAPPRRRSRYGAPRPRLRGGGRGGVGLAADPDGPGGRPQGRPHPPVLREPYRSRRRLPALAHLRNGNWVVVTAPTGTGRPAARRVRPQGRPARTVPARRGGLLRRLGRRDAAAAPAGPPPHAGRSPAVSGSCGSYPRDPAPAPAVLGRDRGGAALYAVGLAVRCSPSSSSTGC